MLIHMSRIIGCSIHATDGDIGKITSAYIDCQRWKIRYFAVDTGGFFGGRDVLIPSASVPAQDLSKNRIHVNLSRDQIRNSPGTDLSFSRATEIAVAQHYGLPMYWEVERTENQREREGLFIPKAGGVQVSGQTVTATDESTGTTIVAERIPEARYLFSADEVCDYRVLATDGEIGEMDDFLVDDASWDLRYAVVDTKKFLAGRKVLIAPRWIDSISGDDSTVRVDLSRDAVGNSPAYDANRPIDADYERRLHDHYAGEQEGARYALWRFNFKRQAMDEGRKLRIVVLAPAVVHWTTDNWKTQQDTKTCDTGTGTHIAELDTDRLNAGQSVHFTFYWPLSKHWENQNFSTQVRRAVPTRERVSGPTETGR